MRFLRSETCGRANRYRRAIGSLIACAVAVGLAAPAQAQPIKVKMALPVKVLVAAPIFLAVDSGALKKQNIDMDIVIFRGGPPSITALLAGEVQFMSVAVDEFLKVAGKGKVIRVYDYAHSNTLNLQMGNDFLKAHKVNLKLPVKERIRQLKGATLGTVTVGGATDVYARWLFKYAGLDPQADVRIIRVGGVPAMLASVKAKQIDGFMLSPPAGQIMQARHLGKIVVPFTEVPPFANHEYFGVTVTPGYLAKNRSIIKKVVDAIQESQALAYRDPKKAAEILHKHSFKQVSEKLLEAALMQARVAFRPGPMTAADWANTIGLMRDAGFKEVENLKLVQGRDWTNEFMK